MDSSKVPFTKNKITFQEITPEGITVGIGEGIDKEKDLKIFKVMKIPLGPMIIEAEY